MLSLWKIFVFYLISCFFHLTILTKNHSELSNTSVKLRMVTECSAQNTSIGFCLRLEKCPTLVKQKNNKTLIETLKCGPKNDNETNPLVCCHKSKKSEQNPLPKECGFQNVTTVSRIIGGKEAKLGEFPWLARLIHQDKSGIKTFGCTGFLISQKFILTAAHCLESENAELLGPIHEIHLGEHNTYTETDCNKKNTTCSDKIQIIKIQKTFTHDSYDKNSTNHHNDIGLIYLKKGAKLTKYVSPICLAEKNEAIEYWLSGWGTTEKGAESSVKLKVSVPLYNFTNCRSQYKKLKKLIINKQLCAGGTKNKDSCSGDSGGPLMFVNKTQWFAVGVVSYGVDCGRENWPAIYTNIPKYIQWIKNTILKQMKKT